MMMMVMSRSSLLGRRNGARAISRSLKVGLDLTGRLFNGGKDLGNTLGTSVFFRLGRRHLKALAGFLAPNHGFR